MREVKFRAWDKACKTMITNANSGLVIHLNGTVSISDVWSTNDIELMQFTGLLDKEDVEIYEGDIVKADGYDVFEVIYEAPRFMALWENRNNLKWNLFNPLILHTATVIGNIHENPELLKN